MRSTSADPSVQPGGSHLYAEEGACSGLLQPFEIQDDYDDSGYYSLEEDNSDDEGIFDHNTFEVEHVEDDHFTQLYQERIAAEGKVAAAKKERIRKRQEEYAAMTDVKVSLRTYL